MLFDTHAHLEDQKFKGDEVEVIKRAREKGVSLILNVGYNLLHAQKSIALADKYDFIYSSVGLHPHDAKDGDKYLWDELYKLARHPKVVALGEMGLDYYWDNSPRNVQRDVFRHQIGMAKDLQLPIIIHDRDAHQDVLTIVKEERAFEVGGVFHAYSGSWEMAKEVLNLGFYISIGGPVTFKNARKILEVVEKAPLTSLLIETDCPYLTPHPYRGKRNEPGFVKLVAEKIAEIKKITYEEVATVTRENGMKIFGIS
ncbi:MAG: TatD DNase family protein [Clostridia bacterium]|jgi:TatD DNase family protein|nr:TatD DNase family protein [Clostridia bacterium]MDN5321559.1 TatD DNase family protein [Clostridia bacterium]